MELNTLIIIGLGIAAAAVTTWWATYKKSSLHQLTDTLEDAIEDATGIDIELDEIVDDIVSAAETIVGDIHESVEDSLEDGDSLKEVIDDAVETIDLDSIKSMTVKTLKLHLKELGLPTSGKKADLLARLVESISTE